MIVLSFLRSVVGGILFLFWTLVCSVLAIAWRLLGGPMSGVDHIVTSWAGGTLLLFGVDFEERGRANLPSGACLYLFNHTSFFDIFVMAHTLKGMRFGAKSELFKIPFFGRAMKLAGVLPITRENRAKVFRVYDRATKNVQLGQQYALAPEGGRNPKETLLPFKGGPFIFAINAQMPVVPVIIKGAAEVLPKHAILPNWKKWRALITIEYLPAVTTEGYTLENRPVLQKKVYDLMKPYFPEGAPTAGVINS